MLLKHLLTTAALGLSLSVAAQSVPSHDMYVLYGTPSDLVTSLKNWQKGQAWGTAAEDENFFISRVPVKQRFLPAEVANPNLTDATDKNFCWCSPTGEMTKKWGPLPRYNFDGDNFNLWQYVKYHSNWSNGWWRVPGAFNDVAHKNGVQTGCTYFIDWGASVNTISEPGKTLFELSKKEGNKFLYAEKLVDFLRYYGIDGLTFNPEGRWARQLYVQFIPFLAECHRIAQEKGYPFRVDWYSFVLNNGALSDNSCTLSDDNANWFHHTESNQPVTDMFFLNYNWSEAGLARSVETAQKHGRSSFDVYAGFDQQGRGYGGNGNAGWSALMKHPVSVVVWGAHDRSQLYASSTEGGQSDYAVQNEYQKKQEMLFSGGNRNVLQLPKLNTNRDVTASFAHLKDWHGYATAIRERSTLNELPFVTRFNLGNGRFMNNEGRTTWQHKWYNIGMQDLLPTWRWWMDNGDGRTPPTQSLQADFTYDDAWFGGSCLRLHGATPRTDVRLFATQWPVANGDDAFRIVLKPQGEAQTHLTLMLRKKGSTAWQTKELKVQKADEWNTIELRASDFGLAAGDEISTVALSAQNTPATYSLLLGEMAFVPKAFAQVPVQPVIQSTKVMKRVYNRADFKVVFDVPHNGARKPEYAGSPIYNEEVGAWYYEIWTKQGEQERLLTTTTSWAAYVVDAPLDPTQPTFQVGVRTVGRDGASKSDIKWSEPIVSPLQVIETLTLDKPVIKPGEEFTIGFEDPNHALADFTITNALTGAKVAEVQQKLSLTTSLKDLGAYDVEVKSGGKTTMNRGLVLITPEATGRLPQITEVKAPQKEVKAGEKITLAATIARGTEADGEPCTVSQSLYMKEPYQFTVDSKVTSSYRQNTFALWFKVEKFEHASLGTLLMTKVNRNYPGTWTEKVWGEMWTAIRPKGYAKNNNIGRDNAANEISVCFDGPKAGTPNYEHNNDVDGLTEGYSLLPNTWYHVAVVKDERNEKLYLNGRLVLESRARGAGPKDWKGANFYVGGSITNLASFTGWIDEVQIWDKALTAQEVQQAMKGYVTAPEGLQGYFTFETTKTDSQGMLYFPNQGANSQVEGGYMTIAKAEGNTTNDIRQSQLTTTLGVPALTGSLPITYESTKWLIENAIVQPNDNEATVSFLTEGKKSITLTATNSWGSTTRTLKDFIVVSGIASGIDGVQAEGNFLVYPRAFADHVDLLFREAGNYEVRLFSLDGRRVAHEIYQADRDEMATLALNVPAGTYVVSILREGRPLQNIKIVKQ